MMEILYAAQTVPGKKRFCLDYSRTYRAGRLGKQKTGSVEDMTAIIIEAPVFV